MCGIVRVLVLLCLTLAISGTGLRTLSSLEICMVRFLPNVTLNTLLNEDDLVELFADGEMRGVAAVLLNTDTIEKSLFPITRLYKELPKKLLKDDTFQLLDDFFNPEIEKQPLLQKIMNASFSYPLMRKMVLRYVDAMQEKKNKQEEIFTKMMYCLQRMWSMPRMNKKRKNVTSFEAVFFGDPPEGGFSSWLTTYFLQKDSLLQLHEVFGLLHVNELALVHTNVTYFADEFSRINFNNTMIVGMNPIHEVILYTACRLTGQDKCYFDLELNEKVTIEVTPKYDQTLYPVSMRITDFSSNNLSKYEDNPTLENEDGSEEEGSPSSLEEEGDGSVKKERKESKKNTSRRPKQSKRDQGGVIGTTTRKLTQNKLTRRTSKFPNKLARRTSRRWKTNKQTGGRRTTARLTDGEDQVVAVKDAEENQRSELQRKGLIRKKTNVRRPIGTVRQTTKAVDPQEGGGDGGTSEPSDESNHETDWESDDETEEEETEDDTEDEEKDEDEEDD